MEDSNIKLNRDWWEEISKENLWYLVGLVASDGCLSGDGRHVDITAKERDFLKDLRLKCFIPNKVCKEK